jgi:hypothetical protein
VKSLTRAALLLALLTAYAAATVRPVLVAGSGRGFDALAPESRFVERAIGEHRFAEALPVAQELRRVHASEPLAAYWLATIYQGLGRAAEARAALDDFERLTGASTGVNAD